MHHARSSLSSQLGTPIKLVVPHVAQQTEGYGPGISPWQMSGPSISSLALRYASICQYLSSHRRTTYRASCLACSHRLRFDHNSVIAKVI
jgi:hypothetical protein